MCADHSAVACSCRKSRSHSPWASICSRSDGRHQMPRLCQKPGWSSLARWLAVWQADPPTASDVANNRSWLSVAAVISGRFYEPDAVFRTYLKTGSCDLLGQEAFCKPSEFLWPYKVFTAAVLNRVSNYYLEIYKRVILMKLFIGLVLYC